MCIYRGESVVRECLCMYFKKKSGLRRDVISLDKSCLKAVVFPPTPVGSGPAVDPRPNTVSYS